MKTNERFCKTLEFTDGRRHEIDLDEDTGDSKLVKLTPFTKNTLRETSISQYQTIPTTILQCTAFIILCQALLSSALIIGLYRNVRMWLEALVLWILLWKESLGRSSHLKLESGVPVL
mmetsp:Transcript_12955/g.23294  ORF Transcript_12955/g.23294 Transcript_12955/m.23294 type:complete len:118 (+) Transcript_12955:311-664(+)